MDHVPTPATLHCAPLGWPGIRSAMATVAAWFDAADPALIVCDVSAEIAQLARICSVPHVKVLQHGDRTDPGHRAAYDGAAGLLAPFDVALAQPDWDASMRARTCFAGGLGVATDLPDREAARGRLGLPRDAHVVVAISGGGGSGFQAAPFGVAARAMPATRWITIGHVARDWHATEPGNLAHRRLGRHARRLYRRGRHRRRLDREHDLPAGPRRRPALDRRSGMALFRRTGREGRGSGSRRRGAAPAGAPVIRPCLERRPRTRRRRTRPGAATGHGPIGCRDPCRRLARRPRDDPLGRSSVPGPRPFALAGE